MGSVNRGVTAEVDLLSVPMVEKRASEADPLREQLLKAAAKVFAEKGYAGTKIMDIVKAAGLSSGAVYGRFASKEELLLEAVLSNVEANALAQRLEGRTVAEALIETGAADGPLNDLEAMQLEVIMASRRAPEVAEAITQRRQRWRDTHVGVLMEQAIADGSLSPEADIDSVIYFVETVHLGLLAQRAAGQFAPNPEAWQAFLGHVMAGIASAPSVVEADGAGQVDAQSAKS